MACLSSILSEFIGAILIAIPITLIAVVLGNEHPLDMYQKVFWVLFIVGVSINVLVWVDKEGNF